MTTNNYPWKVIDPKDYVQIEANQSITFKDVHVLTKLYRPLIGAQAYSLYLSFFADLEFQTNVKGTTISELLTKLDIGIPDFYHARIRLEGLGLLRIYRSKEEEGSYFYELMPPLSAEAFFKDSLLRTLLIEKIGERLFQEALDTLLIPTEDKQAYEETTRSFLDVYHFDFQNTEVLSQTDFMPFDSPQRPKIAETIENTDTFDYDFFKAGLDKHFVSRESLTAEIKELIYTFHIVYGIDEMTMQGLILESADVDSGKVNKNKFTKNVQDNYANKQKAKGIKSEQQLQGEPKAAEPAVDTSELQKEGFSKSEIAIIHHAKKTPPANYLSSIKEQKGGFVTTNEQWVLKELVEQSPLTKEVINILLNYILVGKESVMLEKNYAMTIANDWAQNGVKSAEQAISKIKTLYTQPRKTNNRGQQQGKRNYNNPYQKPRREEKLPDWAKGEKKDTEQEDQLVSAEESDSLQERLARLRKLREEQEDN